jgi:hypothetical protein
MTILNNPIPKHTESLNQEIEVEEVPEVLTQDELNDLINETLNEEDDN